MDSTEKNRVIKNIQVDVSKQNKTIMDSNANKRNKNSHFLVTLLYVLAFFIGISLSTPAQASLSHPAVVSENPADTTPHVLLDVVNNTVYAIEQVGRTMYAGGRFAAVQTGEGKRL